MLCDSPRLRSKGPTTMNHTQQRIALTSAAASLIVGLGACIAPTQSFNEGVQMTATPQRPTVSSNTSTTVPGTVEVEAGIFLDPSTTFDTPLVFKYGVSPNSEAFIALSPYRSVELPGDDGEGLGDVVLGWRQRIAEQENDRPSLAWSVGAKLPTADDDEGLGTGELDVFGALIASYVQDQYTGTAYAQLALLGEPDGSGMDHQETFTLALDHAVGGGAGVFAEVGLVLTPERDNEALFSILGGTWSPVPGLVFDTGVLLGLNDDAPDFALVFGFTRNLGRIAGWALGQARHDP